MSFHLIDLVQQQNCLQAMKQSRVPGPGAPLHSQQLTSRRSNQKSCAEGRVWQGGRQGVSVRPYRKQSKNNSPQLAPEPGAAMSLGGRHIQAIAEMRCCYCCCRYTGSPTTTCRSSGWATPSGQCKLGPRCGWPKGVLNIAPGSAWLQLSRLIMFGL
jgi:hypothetical protein